MLPKDYIRYMLTNEFKTEYSDHNLDRARCQLKLAQDMIQNYSQMQEIIQAYCKEYSHQQ